MRLDLEPHAHPVLKFMPRQVCDGDLSHHTLPLPVNPLKAESTSAFPRYGTSHQTPFSFTLTIKKRNGDESVFTKRHEAAPLLRGQAARLTNSRAPAAPAAPYLVAAAEELAAGRRAQRLRVVALQPHAARPQRVQPRRPDGRAVPAHVAPAQVVGQHQHQVRGGPCRRRPRQAPQQAPQHAEPLHPRPATRN